MNNKELTIEVLDRLTRVIFKNNDRVWYGFCTAFTILLIIVSSGEAEAKTRPLNLLSNLNLSDCRIVQDEHSHIEKGNGSVFAYDVPCVRGRSAEVFAPNYKPIWAVAYKGYDKRLGDYITLRHGELFFIYGHTQSELKVGDRLKKGDFVGNTNKSGMSENYHLHLELWKGNQNVSFKYLEGKGLFVNPKSEDLREQRNWISGKEINGRILNFISQPGMEGFSPTTYWDIRQYSNGYGTVAKNKDEVVTKKIAEQRAREKIQNIREKYKLYNHPVNIQIGVASFVYNIGSLTNKQYWLLNNYHYTALANDIQQYNGYYERDGEGNKIGEKIILKGLEKRRKLEKNIILT